ncbi:MAG: putative quinol monooxygenase [Flavobacteriaceae bacterium]
MKKTIIVQLNIQATKTAQFLELAKTMVNESLTEKGCLTYKLLKKVGTENEFFIYETYVNEKAVEKHNASKHFKIFIHSVMPLLYEEPIIEHF